jgi:hypothetical protein
MTVLNDSSVIVEKVYDTLYTPHTMLHISQIDCMLAPVYLSRLVVMLKISANELLVDPGVCAGIPFRNTLGEPESNLGIGALDGIRSVANVAAHFDAKVSTDRSAGGFARHGCAKHLAALRHSIRALPHHGNNRARSHVRDKAGEELLRLQVFVVFLHVSLARFREFHGNELISFRLEPLDNFADKPSLNTIGLDHDVSALHF